VRGGRLLGLVALLLVVAATALWGASQLVWFRVAADLPGRAGQAVEVTGGQVQGSLGGIALLALAGTAGVVATAGVPRRLVGALLVLAGLGVAGLAVLPLLVDPFATDAATVPAPPGVDADLLRYRPATATAGPWLAVLAGALLAAAGGAALLAERRLPRLGARYAAPGARRPPADPDRAAWQDLDAGRDPTDP
jgi:uncharacterized membrane protein (TIGR02234 family)